MLRKMEKGILVSFVVLATCSAFVMKTAAAEPPGLAKLSGAEKARVAKMIEGAKKEGELVAYSGPWHPDTQQYFSQRQAMSPYFGPVLK